MDVLNNKNIIVMGIRNKKSIAWGIAKRAYEQGANLILTYEKEKERETIEELTKNFNNSVIIKCDVSNDEDVEKLFKEVKNKFHEIHGIAHCIAHATPKELKRNFFDTSREGFSHTLDISAYSLVTISKHAKDLMHEGGSIVTLSYHGATRVMTGYNVMGVAKAALESTVRYLANELGPIGIRVNTISPGPIKTGSSKDINDFDNLHENVERKSPLRKSVTPEDIGDAAVFFLSDLSKSVTGEILYVDNGYNIMGD
ncbi:MAG: enoyl-ACP reductase [Clostridiales bacterium]|nr:enoyl-ACP reductase [Clostridiales bacterium]